jgi:hypothetical protein
VVGASEASFLGGDHVDAIAEGTDLLPALADGVPAGSGFTLPLGSGTYSYVIQQTGSQTSGYTVSFTVGIAGHWKKEAEPPEADVVTVPDGGLGRSGAAPWTPRMVAAPSCREIQNELQLRIKEV